MINRHYFIATQLRNKDGNLAQTISSYFIRKSFLPQHTEAYFAALDDIKDRHDLGDTDFAIIAFNRI
tara:strand:- start:1266 stop:1466 length:201 start_codon:yes stop_codon:yes gene_type:complete